jgi:hypothetical protein
VSTIRTWSCLATISHHFNLPPPDRTKELPIRAIVPPLPANIDSEVNGSTRSGQERVSLGGV